MFFSSHIIGEVETLADRVAIIRKGVIIEEATPQKLTEMSIRRIQVRLIDPIDPEIFSSIAGVKLVSSRNGLKVDLEVEGDMDRLIKFLANYNVKDLVTNTRSLEDIFLKYYQAVTEDVN